MSDTPASPSGKRWYVVHAYSGMEKSVQRALQERIERAGMQDKFGRSSCRPKKWSKSKAARRR
jgi:transcriptional antiterminator NusG